jgi:hypothetical protein
MDARATGKLRQNPCGACLPRQTVRVGVDPRRSGVSKVDSVAGEVMIVSQIHHSGRNYPLRTAGSTEDIPWHVA